MSQYDPALVATFLLVLDLCGTFVFALSGAMAGVKHRLDLFGVLVLSFAAATAGGIIRDVLLGVEPPPAIRDWRYLGVSLLAGFITFRWPRILDRVRSSVLVLDAAGLGLFAVSGALKALAFAVLPTHGDVDDRCRHARRKRQVERRLRPCDLDVERDRALAEGRQVWQRQRDSRHDRRALDR